MVSRVVTFDVGEDTEVQFEIDPPEGFRQVSADKTLGQVREAVRPAVEAASVVLDRVKALGPDAVTVKFGIKVSGSANWLVAKAASEGNFEITLSWKPSAEPGQPSEVDAEAG